MQCLAIEGKITIFKRLARAKVVYLALLTVVPNRIIDELIKIQTNSKIKHKTLLLDHKQVDVTFNITSLQCSWLKRIFDDSFLEWKVISKDIYIKTHLVITLIFIPIEITN